MSGKPDMIPCAVPGCDVKVRADRAAKVCSLHLHRRGYCQCDRCAALYGRAVKTDEPRPGVRWFNATTVTLAGACVGHRISLPKEPWDVG